uniref:Uncharacterized protein n=1 Tax=Pithovirus LCPAC406 TaxID=2506599 RepID=A0A481ZD61_9VIRU|nr:MAG: hypothetical protein LCPAC406_02070 [Pithovirus LCPAC406]
MAVYQVYNNFVMGLTTNFELAREFLRQVSQDKGASDGIYLLKLDEKTGEFKEEDFVKSEDIIEHPLRKLTKEERKLPEELFNLNVNREYEIEKRVFLTERNLLENLGFYHEKYGEMLSSFGSYMNDFVVYVLFNEVIEDSSSISDMSLEDAIERVKMKHMCNFAGKIKINKITYLDNMKSIGKIYIPRIERENLQKVFDLAKQFNKMC